MTRYESTKQTHDLCCLAAAAGLLLYAALAPGQQNEEPGQDAPQAWVVLSVELVSGSAGATAIVAPPPGAYAFAQGDRVVLHAHDGNHTPLSVRWTGDAPGEGAYHVVEMDRDKTVRVHFEANPDAAAGTEEASASPWYDVPEQGGMYTFVGGGNLYGWFEAKRHKHRGAGFTHLIHGADPDRTLWYGNSLNLEHIMTGAGADKHRSLFTPLTDPMRFRVESSASLRVQWPAETAAWKMDCEMRYTFSGGDALDMEFTVTPRGEEFPLGYVIFMWASYHHLFADPAIHFQGVQDGEEGWIRFGSPADSDQGFGGVVGHFGAPPLVCEEEGQIFNILASEQIFFTSPFYYGLIAMGDPADDPSHDSPATRPAGDLRAFTMMFEHPEATRFVLWNWGSPPKTSAWDWQYVLENPKRNVCYGTRMRLLYTPFQGPDQVVDQYHDWRQALSSDPRHAESSLCVTPDRPAAGGSAGAWPRLARYRGPFNPAVVSEDLAKAAAGAIARGEQEEAERLYRNALTIHPEEPRIQRAFGEFLEHLDRTGEALELYFGALRIDGEDPYTADRADAAFRKMDDMAMRTAFWDGLRQADPKAVLPALRLAMALQDGGNYEASRGVLETLLREHPSNADLLLYYGNALLQGVNTHEGVEKIQEAIAVDTALASPAARMLSDRARQANAAGDYALAETLYRAAHATSPDDLSHKVNLGEVLETAGRLDEALALYKEVLGALPESVYPAERLDALFRTQEAHVERLAFWRELHQQQPEAVTPALRLGMAQFDDGEYEDSRETLESLHDRAPEDPAVLFHLGKALLYSEEKDAVGNGVERLARAVQRDANHASAAGVAIASRAALAWEAGMHELAERLFRAAIEVSPDDLWHKTALGQLLQDMGQEEEARVLYRDVLREAPESPVTAELLEGLSTREEDLEASEAFWTSLSQLHPESALTGYYLGLALERGNKPEEAADAYRNVLAAASGHARALYRLGALEILQGCMESGMDRIQESVREDPNLTGEVSGRLRNLASHFAAQEVYGTAIRLYQAALDIAPDDLWALVGLGEIYERTENTAAALEAYRSVLTEKPESPVTAEKLHLLLLDTHATPEAVLREWEVIVERHPDAVVPLKNYDKARERVESQGQDTSVSALPESRQIKNEQE